MEPTELLAVLGTAEKLKNNTRHSWLTSGRHESVAEHTFRLAIMAYFMKDEFPNLNMDRVIQMCLFHDMGEAFTGDIPAFLKNSEDEKKEETCVTSWISSLPEPYRNALSALFAEMNEQKTEEAKLYRTLDKLETIIQHNESDIATWLPLEYDLQLTYARKESGAFPYTMRLREEIDRITKEKIRKESKS